MDDGVLKYLYHICEYSSSCPPPQGILIYEGFKSNFNKKFGVGGFGCLTDAELKSELGGSGVGYLRKLFHEALWAKYCQGSEMVSQSISTQINKNQGVN